MIEQTAVVIAAEAGRVEVEAERREACGGCAVKGTCGVALLDRAFGRYRSRFHLADPIGLRPGQRVLLGIDEASLLSAATLVYLLPLLGLLFGAGLPAALARAWGLAGHGADWIALFGGGLGFALSLRWVAGYSQRSHVADRYRAVLLGPAPSTPPVAVPLPESACSASKIPPPPT